MHFRDCLELFATIKTSIDNWRVLAFFRAIDTSTVLDSAWGCFKLNAATFTRNRDSITSIPGSALIAAFNRAVLTASAFKSMTFNAECFSAVLANGVY